MQFVRGRVHQYYGVPENMRTLLLQAPSKGHFWQPLRCLA